MHVFVHMIGSIAGMQTTCHQVHVIDNLMVTTCDCDCASSPLHRESVAASRQRSVSVLYQSLCHSQNHGTCVKPLPCLLAYQLDPTHIQRWLHAHTHCPPASPLVMHSPSPAPEPRLCATQPATPAHTTHHDQHTTQTNNHKTAHTKFEHPYPTWNRWRGSSRRGSILAGAL